MGSVLNSVAELRRELGALGTGNIVEGALVIGLLTREDLYAWERQDMKRFAEKSRRQGE